MSDDKGLERAREPSPSTCRGAEPAAPATVSLADLDALEARIGEEFDGELHLSEAEVRRLIAWARAALSATPWRPVEEAPRDGAWVFGYWKGCPITAYPCVMFWGDGEWLSPAWTDFFPNPTHWMPLPEPPEGV